MAKPFEDLRGRMPAPRQDRARKRTDAMLTETKLAELRRSRGVTQDQLAKELDVRQAAVSKLEGRDDLLLSTLAAYVQALGGRLEVVARFGKHAVQLDPGAVTAKAGASSTVSRSKRGRKLPNAKD